MGLEVETGVRGEGSVHKIKVHRAAGYRGAGSPVGKTPMLPSHSCPVLNTYK